MPPKNEHHPKPGVTVIGAGAAGFSAALELSGRGHHVTLIEQDTLGSGSSGRNPGRMGHGFHYADINTAITYLRSSVKVQRRYPGYLIGQDLPVDTPVRHGRYFITKNSDSPKEDIIRTYEALHQEYTRLIEEDKNNEVFGPSERFFRVIQPDEYERDVNRDIVDIGIETSEHLFNWKKFLLDIRAIIQTTPNITLYENTRVEAIERAGHEKPRFRIKTRTKENQVQLFETDYLINSTWQNIEYLNDQIGLRMMPDSRTNRLKVLLVVQLPESLKNSHSMFFCMGQHCMISNMGDGRAMMTYARVTNMETSCNLSLSYNAQRLLNGGATQKEKDTIAQQILAGVSQYIPQMANAVVEDVVFGVVQTEGKLTLEQLADLDNPFHKRDYYGVREEQIGVVSNPCVKLFYFINNGELTADLIEAQIKATTILNDCMQDIKNIAAIKKINLSPAMNKLILYNLERYESSEIIAADKNKIIEAAFKTIEARLAAHKAIRPYFFAKRLEEKNSAAYVSNLDYGQGRP